MLNAFAISGLFIMGTCAVMTAMMFSLARNRSNIIWGVFCICVFFWGMGAYQVGTHEDPTTALGWWRIAYVGVILIPTLFVHFVHAFLGQRQYVMNGVFYGIAALFMGANLLSDRFIASTHPMFGTIQYLSPTPLYSAFVVFFFAAIVYSHLLLYHEYRMAKEEDRRQQIAYFFVASFIGFTGGSTSFLPVYGFDIYPYPNILVAVYPLIMGYAILRHRLFDIRLVMAEILTIIIWPVIGVRFILSWGTRDAIIDGILLFIVLILGILGIRSVMREMAQREHLREMTETLQDANQRLQELGRLKSQFLSFASHQLKAPLAAIKWQAQLFTDGTLGTLPDPAKKTASEIEDSVNQLIRLVEDFLDLRKLEEGKVKYEMEETDLVKLTGEIVRELQPTADKKKLRLEFKAEASRKNATVDPVKFRQVIQNLVDNAIKYTPRGSVTVRIVNEDHAILMSVADSGTGIPEKMLSAIFEQFVRAPSTEHTNEGSGLGLYIAKQIVLAHRGEIWAESNGEGKGSVFYVRIPSI